MDEAVLLWRGFIPGSDAELGPQLLVPQFFFLILAVLIGYPQFEH